MTVLNLILPPQVCYVCYALGPFADLIYFKGSQYFSSASATSDGYSNTWHMRFMIAENGHFSEAKSADILFLGCIFPLRNDFVRNSGCSLFFCYFFLTVSYMCKTSQIGILPVAELKTKP